MKFGADTTIFTIVYLLCIYRSERCGAEENVYQMGEQASFKGKNGDMM